MVSPLLRRGTYEAAIDSITKENKPSLNLESNDETTEYFINGEKVGQGKRLSLVANHQPPLTIVAKPTDCKQKTEILKGSFTDNAVVRFYFMGEDCPLSRSGLPRNAPPRR